MWPDSVSNPGPFALDSDALPTAQRGPALPLLLLLTGVEVMLLISDMQPPGEPRHVVPLTSHLSPSQLGKHRQSPLWGSHDCSGTIVF